MPKKVRSLWDELEDFARVHIRVEAQPAGGGRPPGVRLEQDGAALILGANGYMPAGAVFHELHHLRRAWIEGTPSINTGYGDPTALAFAARIENDLEHLHVFERQREADLDLPGLRSNQFKAIFSAFPWPNNSAHQRREACLMYWLLHRYLEDAETEAVRRAAISLGLMDEAMAFRENALALLGDKPRLVSCAFHFLNHEPNLFRLRFTKIQTREYWFEPIPAYCG